jgi:hypothetical protein
MKTAVAIQSLSGRGSPGTPLENRAHGRETPGDAYGSSAQDDRDQNQGDAQQHDCQPDRPWTDIGIVRPPEADKKQQNQQYQIG